MNEYLKQEMKVLILKGMRYAKLAHEEVFSNKAREFLIVGYIAQASSFVHSAKAIFICKNEEIGHDDFASFFHAFDTFADEVMANVRTDHSHQWSDIEFNRLQDKYREVASILGVIE